jgi:hypothetical protein
MKRTFDIIVLGLGVLTAVTLAAVAYAQPAAPASAASAPPALTPGKACGAGGTGLTLERKLLTRQPGEASDQRIDKDGFWRPCQPCLPAVHEAFRVWTVGPNVCTTATPYDANPHSLARDRTLFHGDVGLWRQVMGPMRGYLTESCQDGVRRVVSAGCAPALECDAAYSTSDDGGRTVYTYDARPADKRVPLWGYVHATSQDGKRLRLQCVAGDLVKAPEPTATPTPGIKPRTVTCGPQSFAAGEWRWAYRGPRVDIGAIVEVERRGITPTQDGGGVKAEALCMPTGQLKLQHQGFIDPSNPWVKQ